MAEGGFAVATQAELAAQAVANTAAFVDVTGDTMTGALMVTSGGVHSDTFSGQSGGSVDINLGSGTNTLDLGTASSSLEIRAGTTPVLTVSEADKTVTVNQLFSLGSPSELTIDKGVVTATRSYHTVDTEGNKSKDDVVTINGCTGSTVGTVLVLTAADDKHDVKFKRSGNLRLDDDRDFTLKDTTSTLTLLCNPALTWSEISRSDTS